MESQKQIQCQRSDNDSDNDLVGAAITGVATGVKCITRKCSIMYNTVMFLYIYYSVNIQHTVLIYISES